MQTNFAAVTRLSINLCLTRHSRTKSTRATTARRQSKDSSSIFHHQRGTGEGRGRGGDAPDNAVGAATDGADGWGVLGGDLEEVSVHVVQHVAAPVRRHTLDLRSTAAAAGGIHGSFRLLPRLSGRGRGGGT